MKIAIMQPYFFPHMGYFQLIKEADIFVFLDDAQFTKGWLARNQIILKDINQMFHVDLVASSQKTKILDKKISPSYDPERNFRIFLRHFKHYMVNKINLRDCFENKTDSLSDFNIENLMYFAKLLNIEAKYFKSSQLITNRSENYQEWIVDLCKILDGKVYINNYSGRHLYDSKLFSKNGIDLQFLQNISDLGKPRPTIIQDFLEKDYLQLMEMLKISKLVKAE